MRHAAKGRVLLALWLIPAFLMGCGGGDAPGSGGGSGNVELRIMFPEEVRFGTSQPTSEPRWARAAPVSLVEAAIASVVDLLTPPLWAQAAPAFIERITLVITGAGFSPISASIEPREGRIAITVPEGPARTFRVEAFEIGEIAPTFVGETIQDIVGDTLITILLERGERKPALVSIALIPTNPSIPLGTRLQFTVTGTFSNGTIRDLPATSVTFESSDTSMATIDSQGLVTTNAEGATIITAMVEGIRETITLVVEPALASPRGIVVEADGQLVLVDPFLKAAVQVDPISGNRRTVSNISTGSGPTFGFPMGVAIETGGQLVVADSALNALVRVDPVSGDRTTVSDATTGSGPSFSFPQDDFLVGIAVEANGQLVVADAGGDAVVRVDPISGNRTIISGTSRGSGPPFINPRGIAVEANGQLVVADAGGDAVVRVDPISGNRTIISGTSRGSGPPFDFPVGIAVEASGDLLVTDISLDAVVRVDLVSGDRTIVSETRTGSGLSLSFAEGIALGPGQLVLVDSGRDAVVRVDPVRGDRTTVSDTTRGSGPVLVDPRGIAVGANGQLVVVDTALDAVVRVDPVSGDRTIVSDATRGSGPPLANPRGIAVEATGLLLVVDVAFDAVVRVDATTGDRVIVSK